ncbi:urease subunit beta [Streptomyces sp. x-80]|uniref:urease subunit beta n=1 Tax=Streptomyces sp. x-80 TaxID=2789282 RepID=UPI00397FBFE1
MTPGEIIYADGDITLNTGREIIEVGVQNTGNRSIAIGSHLHIFEASPALQFDRAKARGFRPNIPAGDLYLIDPGKAWTISLVEISP